MLTLTLVLCAVITLFYPAWTEQPKLIGSLKLPLGVEDLMEELRKQKTAVVSFELIRS